MSKEALDRVWLVMEAIAVANPDLRMKDGVLLAQKVYAEVDWMREQGISAPPSGDIDILGKSSWTPMEWARYVGGTEPDVNRLVEAGKLIPAIKEVRARHRLDLAAAKGICDLLRDNPSLRTAF